MPNYYLVECVSSDAQLIRACPSKKKRTEYIQQAKWPCVPVTRRSLPRETVRTLLRAIKERAGT